MTESDRRTRWSVRKLLVLAALASLAVLAFALTPGGAQAGISGSNQLTVQLTGTGPGVVVQGSGIGNGTPLAINCSKAAGAAPSTGVCVANVPFGDPPEPWIGLVAQPQAGSEFTGWTVSPGSTPISACGLNSACYFQMNAAVTVRANFVQTPQTPVTVLLAGSAGSQGTVASNPAGISCNNTKTADCTGSFPIGSQVTLTAAGPAGTTFAGWSAPTGFTFGNCLQGNASPTCTLVVGTTPIYAVATFNTATFALTVSVTGDGGVSSNIQPGIDCGSSTNQCSFSFASGTQVILTVEADTGFKFSGWGGACSGTSSCTLTITSAQSVTATFVKSTVQASVTKISASKKNGERYVNVKVNAGQTVKVKVVVKQNGKTIGSKTASGLGPGKVTVQTELKNSAKNANASVTVTISAPNVTGKTVKQTIKIPAG